MTDVIELELTDVSEEKLWAHGIHLESAFDLLDGDFKTFPDPRNPSRRFMIGFDRHDQLITLVIGPAGDQGICRLITGWPSTTAEATWFSRPGGTKHAG